MTLTKHLIADYLKRHGHSSTLKSFEEEANIDTTGTTVQYEKLEDIIADRTEYLQHSEVVKESEINKVENAQLFKPWSKPSPQNAKELNAGGALVVHSSTLKLIADGSLSDVCILSSADKSITLIDLTSKEPIARYTGIHSSVVKCCYGIDDTNKLISCGMDGKAKLMEIRDHDHAEVTSECQLHPRLVTDFKLLKMSDDEYLIFSIGWDLTVRAHRLKNHKFEYLSQFKLLSNATAIEVTTFEENPIVLVTRLDSSQLAYFTLKNDALHEVTRVSLNDAEFSTHGFTGMSITLSTPTITPDTKIAVGTSHIPYLRVVITSPPDLATLLPKLPAEASDAQQLSRPTLRGLLLGNFNTMSPQDKFSQARIIWRPDASGIWVAGDDGIIRGLEFKSGAIAQQLVGHQEKQRIKCMVVTAVGDKEVVVSAGVDKKVIYWD